MERFQRLSLKALQIFSVAARHMNFSKAAEELFITPSAVSHQIKRLEEVLGVKLFEKKGKHLALTPTALPYSRLISQSFTQMREATRELTDYKKNVIHLGVDAPFAVKRLTPALGLWQESHPDLDLRLRMISCDDNLPDLDLDVIFSGKVEEGFYDSEKVTEERYHPICSWSLAATFVPKTLPQMITTVPLIDLENIDSWQLWHTDRHLTMPKTAKVLYFSHTLLMFQAVLAGQGIALLEISLIKNELETGELVMLDPKGFIPPGSGYYYSSHKRRRGDPNIAALKRWIVSLLG